ncbi:MAG TPA: hypothetical protein VMP67_10040 [Candidatus Limnocylindria bacterium]|nr:hypothetical protein [Candidatus Limnocylindria bacterium]
MEYTALKFPGVRAGIITGLMLLALAACAAGSGVTPAPIDVSTRTTRAA